MKKIQREYVTVNVPSDCTDNPEERANLAFIQAEEHFQTWKSPCNWRIVWDDGEDVRVCRESYKTDKPKPHYHVLVGLEGGYMPDSNYPCETLELAIACAMWEKELSLEMGMKVSGNIRKDQLYVCVPENAASYTLNTLIEITECYEPDCLEDYQE